MVDFWCLVNSDAQFEEKLEPCLRLLLCPNLRSIEFKQETNKKYVYASVRENGSWKTSPVDKTARAKLKFLKVVLRLTFNDTTMHFFFMIINT